MRKVIVSTFMSLDGVIENPMWSMSYWSDQIAAFQQNDLFTSDALLLGRKTYEGFAEAWSARAGADDFADRMNALPKYVPSRTLAKDAGIWNATILKDDVVGEIAKLKQQPGQNILKYGGGELLNTLVQHRLLDELHVLMYPVVVGKGERLFPEGSEATLKLVDSKTFDVGVLALTYTLADPR